MTAMNDMDDEGQPAGSPPEKKRERPHRYRGGLQQWDSLMDRIIDEAREAGKFEKLRGEGKPLEMDDNPHAGDKRLAYKILKDNNFTLPWISERKELLRDIERWRFKLKRFWREVEMEWRAAASDNQRAILQERWRRLRTGWQDELHQLNRRIHTLNLQVPSDSVALVPLSLKHELARFGAPETL